MTTTIVIFTVLLLVMFAYALLRMSRQEVIFAEMEDEIVVRKALIHFEQAVGRYGRSVNSFGRTNIACYAEALVAKYSVEFKDKAKVNELKGHLNKRINEVSGIEFGSHASTIEPNTRRTRLA